MKKNIAVVSGGDSGEFEISIQSGEIVEKYLDKTKYNVYPVIIKKGDWYYDCKNNNNYNIDRNDFSIPMFSEKINFDCVFIAVHGTPGEDGKLQGYFDMLGIPYTSCNHATSALTFNKHFCKSVVQNSNVKTSASAYLHKGQKNFAGELTHLKFPFFVKPNNGGSSVGMSKINKMEELEPALQKAFNEDNEILVEEFIRGREITCGVFKYKNEIITLPVTEVITKKDWFDYEAKYDPLLADEIVPAQIPQDIYKECQEISVTLYEKLNCAGVVRFDYIFNDNGIYFLEVNTVPGLTEASLVPKMALAHGLTLTKLFGMLVEEAMYTKS